MSEKQPDDEIEINLRDYFRIIWVHKWVVIIVAFVCLVGGIAIAFLLKPVYESKAQILYVERNLYNIISDESKSVSTYNPEIDFNTQIGFLNSQKLKEIVISKLGLIDLKSEDLEKMVKIQTIPNTRIVEIIVNSNNPKLSADLANTISNEYINWYYDTNLRYIDDILRETESKLFDYKNKVDKLSFEIKKYKDEWESNYLSLIKDLELEKQIEFKLISNLSLMLSEQQMVPENLQTEYQLKSEQYQNLSQKYENLKIVEKIFKSDPQIQIISEAKPAEKPIKPNKKLIIGSSSVIGIVFGLILAFITEAWRREIKKFSDT